MDTPSSVQLGLTEVCQQQACHLSVAPTSPGLPTDPSLSKTSSIPPTKSYTTPSFSNDLHPLLHTTSPGAATAPVDSPAISTPHGTRPKTASQVCERNVVLSARDQYHFLPVSRPPFPPGVPINITSMRNILHVIDRSFEVLITDDMAAIHHELVVSPEAHGVLAVYDPSTRSWSMVVLLPALDGLKPAWCLALVDQITVANWHRLANEEGRNIHVIASIGCVTAAESGPYVVNLAGSLAELPLEQWNATLSSKIAITPVTGRPLALAAATL